LCRGGHIGGHIGFFTCSDEIFWHHGFLKSAYFSDNLQPKIIELSQKSNRMTIGF